MIDTRPLGTLQVDVDDLWVYYESVGLRTPPDVAARAYVEGIPRLLDLFDRYGLRATFFVCGRDLPAQAQTVAEMIRRGHEVANHSAEHRNGFARLSPADKRADIAAAGESIARATGQTPVGFKSPGFSFSPDLPDVLAELGYLYDSSLLPTFYAPVLRALQSQLSHGEVDPTHYGQATHGLAPLKPWKLEVRSWKLEVGSWRSNLQPPTSNLQPPTSNLQPPIWEAPVTTMPLTRLPIHSTFVLRAGRWLFDLGFALVRARKVPINYLLHAADVLDAVADPALASYGFLAQPWAQKRPLYEHMLEKLSMAYRLVPTRDFVQDRMPDGD